MKMDDKKFNKLRKSEEKDWSLVKTVTSFAYPIAIAGVGLMMPDLMESTFNYGGPSGLSHTGKIGLNLTVGAAGLFYSGLVYNMVKTIYRDDFKNYQHERKKRGLGSSYGPYEIED